MAGLKISQLTSSLAPSLTGVTTVVLDNKTYKSTLQSLRQVLVDNGSHVFTGSQVINGSLTVNGSVTAQQYILSSSVTNIVTETISGSSNFGNSFDDRHNFTGSVFVTGSLQSTTIAAKDFLFVSGFAVIGVPNHHTGSNAERLHVGSSGSINIAHFQANNEYYSQVNITNKNSGSLASSDLVLTANNGDETVHFVNLGINSSTYNAGYVGYENDAYLLNVGKDLYVGTVGGTNHPAKLKLFANNSWVNPQITIHTGSQITFNTSSFTNGYTYEFSGSVKLKNQLKVDGSVTASYFVGDGSRLTNLPNGLGGGNIADFTFTSETITNGNVNVVATDGDIILNADGGVYIGSSNGGNSIVTSQYFDSVIGDTSRINNGTGHSITDNLDNIIGSINDFTTNKLVNGDLEVILDSKGSLNTPLLIPTTFTIYLTEDKYTGPNNSFTVNGEPWEFEVHYVVDPNGVVETQINNNIVFFNNPGYNNNDSFEFGYDVHGISGYTLEISLYNVQQNQAGWTRNIAVNPPPLYPATIKSSGAIVLESNSNRFIFGTEGKTTLPSDLDVNGSITTNQIYGDSNDGFNGVVTITPVNDPNYLDAGQFINIYPTNDQDANHIHIAAGPGGDLLIGDDNTYIDVNNDGSIYVQGTLNIGQTTEKIHTSGIDGSLITLDFLQGSVFYITGTTVDFDVSLFNFPNLTGRGVGLTFMIEQGATPYIINELIINDSSVQILWNGGVPPTGNSNSLDIISFSLLTIGETIKALGQLTTFS